LDVGGKPVELCASRRRTLYASVDRQFLPTVLRVFDFANPDLHIAHRSATSVPQQALYFMNAPYVVERSKVLARVVQESGAGRSAECCVRKMYRAVYQREPTETQLQAALRFIQAADDSGQGSEGRATGELDGWEQLAQVLIASNEFLFVD
jgi:hypothetical protein